MHARIVTFTGVPDIDTAIAVLHENVVPVMRDQKGYRGLHASADRSHNVMGVLSIWDTEAERDASWDAVAPVRQQNLDAVGGDVSVDRYEMQLQVIGDVPPAPGSALLIVPVEMDPAMVDENLAAFRSEVLPEITASPGFQAVRLLVNRETGRGMTGTVWSDQEAMAEGAAAAEARRPRAAARGVRFGELSYREIVLTDIG